MSGLQSSVLPFFCRRCGILRRPCRLEAGRLFIGRSITLETQADFKMF
nr:hypothetical protein NCPCFENI_00485 [Cupriavidus sp.]